MPPPWHRYRNLGNLWWQQWGTMTYLKHQNWYIWPLTPPPPSTPCPMLMIGPIQPPPAPCHMPRHPKDVQPPQLHGVHPTPLHLGHHGPQEPVWHKVCYNIHPWAGGGGGFEGAIYGQYVQGWVCVFFLSFSFFFWGGFFCFALYLLLIQILSQPLSLWFCYSGVMF